MYLLAALQYEDPTIVRKPAPPVPRPRKACRTCRNLKTKCLPGDSGPTGRCSRCTRLKLDCEYIHLPRGPRKGSTRRQSAPNVKSHSPPNPSPASPRRHSHAEDQSNRGPPSIDGSREREEEWLVPPQRKRLRPWDRDSLDSPLTSTPSTTANASPPVPRSVPSSMAPPDTDGQSVSLDHDTPGYQSLSPSTTTTHHDATPQALNFLATEMRTTLEEYLDPSTAGDQSPRQTLIFMADAVSAGLITECDACFLFRRFEQQVSPSSHLFDPGYHTFDRVRKSVPLFNAIMYASARFFAPNVADALYEMAMTMINRALQAGSIDIKLVQALLVLVYWKKPKDPTAYQKLGLATRLMCQLRVEWDLNPDRTITHEAERAKVDAERTAYNAFSMDSSYAMMLRLPVMPWSLPKSSDLMRWATAHRHLNVPGDYFMVFVTECWELQRGIGNVAADGRPDTQIDGSGIIDRIAAMTERWDNHPCLTGVLRYLAKLLGKTFLLKAHIVAARSKNNCVSIACLLDDISDIIRHLKVSGEAVFLNDLSVSMLSTPAVIVYNGRNDFDPDTMACAAAFVRDMSDLFRTLPPSTPDNHALRSVQRCYLRVEGAIDRYTAGMYEAHDNIVGQLHQLLADNWPALAFSPENAISSSVLDPSWLASMQFM